MFYLFTSIMGNNIALIGLGPHAKRIYLNGSQKIFNGRLKLVIDLESKEGFVKKVLKETFPTEKIFTCFIPDYEKDFKDLSEKTKKYLSNMFIANDIGYAIISTEPKAHFAYSKFLLDNNINVLCDKPITSPEGVIYNIESANNIFMEYKELYDKYLPKFPNINFMVQCQRRFHVGYQYIKTLCAELIKEYNIPITYIDIFHNDGMWNMPNELYERENHPYKYGYGKLFHSGYHFIDLLARLLEVNKGVDNPTKKVNSCTMYNSVRRPADLFSYCTREDHNKLLKCTFDEELFIKNKMGKFGELDFYSTLKFCHNNDFITHVTLNLLQSGFSRRSRSKLPENTYKGNGRIRHERVNIHIGPLCNIQVHSYQAYEVKDRDKIPLFEVGGIEHFDIYVFRNSGIIGGIPFEKKNIRDLSPNDAICLGHNEHARIVGLQTFLKGNLASNLLDHKFSVLLLEKMYYSIASGENNITFSF